MKRKSRVLLPCRRPDISTLKSEYGNPSGFRDRKTTGGNSEETRQLPEQRKEEDKEYGNKDGFTVWHEGKIPSMEEARQNLLSDFGIKVGMSHVGSSRNSCNKT
jgi:hypothetical protein